MCTRLSTLSATLARSTRLDDERRDRLHMRVLKCVSSLVLPSFLSSSIFAALALLGALLGPLRTLLGPLGGSLGGLGVPLGGVLGGSWGRLGGVLGACWGVSKLS